MACWRKSENIGKTESRTFGQQEASTHEQQQEEEGAASGGHRLLPAERGYSAKETCAMLAGVTPRS